MTEKIYREGFYSFNCAFVSLKNITAYVDFMLHIILPEFEDKTWIVAMLHIQHYLTAE